MTQMLMQWTVQPVELPKIPDGFTLKRFCRGGTGEMSEEEFAGAYVRLMDDPEDIQFNIEGFKKFYGSVIPEVWTHPYNREMFDLYYADKLIPEDGIFMVLDESGRMRATASIQLEEHIPNSATLHNVKSDRTLRGKGLGKIVTLAVMQDMARRKYPLGFLTTDDWRLPAISLYLKMGWNPVLYDDAQTRRWQNAMRSIGIAECTAVDGESYVTVRV